MKITKYWLPTLLTLAILVGVTGFPVRAAENGVQVTVCRVQGLTPGNAFNPATAPDVTDFSPGDVAVLTIGFRNDTDQILNISGFSVKLRYSSAQVTPYTGDAPFTYDSYQVSAELENKPYAWTTTGNAEKSFTAVAAAGTRNYAVNPGSTLVLARMAFRVNADAALTFDVKKTYVTAQVEGKRQTFKFDALQTVRLHTIGAYAITAVDGNGVTLTNPAPVTLAVSYFDEKGQFLSAATKAVPANAGTVTFPVSNANKARVMLLDNDYRPLCVYG